MIINSSRADLFQQCRQKMWNWDVLRLLSRREADPLMIGNAFHTGVAHFYATKNLTESVELAEGTFRHQLEGQTILAEEQSLVEQNIRFAKTALEKYAKHWTEEQFTVLMPEVRFRVPLPNTEHHCWFAHQLLHPKGAYSAREEECTDQRCQQPHFFAGRTDAVVSWRNMIWLLEHKTTAVSGQMFFDKFLLDNQTTGYLYGIWKQTGTRPHGFILNIIKKPYKNASDPFAVSFEREAYVRDEKSLEEFEHEIIKIATNYEQAVKTSDIFKNTHSCVAYNRRCYYFDLCQRHQNVEEGEFRIRPEDYVNLSYYDILSLPKEKEPLDDTSLEMLDTRND